VRWFAVAARELPWRMEPRDPYRVLVSEAMLQQTQVERVIPRYRKFVARFPTLTALAAAPEEEVLEAWSGLGYYRRARQLHRLARAVAAAGGRLPRDPEALERLPGVGPYTAAAVASLAFGERVPVLDGNVLRVGARVLRLPGDPRAAAARRAVAAWALDLMEGADPGVVNEALMELGATVCRPRAPRCGACPLAPWCAARAAGAPERYPPPRRVRPPERVRWAAAVIRDGAGRWLLAPVTGLGVLEGLWLPPIAAVDGGGPEAAALRAARCGGTAARPLPPVRHAITHRRIEVTPVVLEGCRAAPEGWRWADPETPGLPTSSLLGKLAARVADSE